MLRLVAAALPLLALAGCGGSPDPPPAPPPAGAARIGDLRSADARSPLLAAHGGTWRCATDGRIQLAITAEGEATLSIDRRLLASVAPTRSVVHRACDRALVAPGGGSAGARVRIGGVVIRCSVPGDVLVGFDHGDLTVRSRAGRFVAGAAIRADRVGVAGYLGGGCAVAR
jgi:hypothetical protein